MQADWEDAPRPRDRAVARHRPFILALVCTCLVAGAFAYYSETSPTPVATQTKHVNAPPPRTIQTPIAQPAPPVTQRIAEISWANDDYDAQVRRLLNESAPQDVGGEGGRQTVFTDATYVPAGTVNTISMAVPRQASAQQTSTAPRPGYVTVVQESKPSCWPFKEGSIECRRHKKGMKNAYNQRCYDSAHNYTEACRRAALYNPVQ